jgi:uncharacterized Zn finger protein (UPF0148 family)
MMAKQILDLRCPGCHIVWREWINAGETFVCPSCGENLYPVNAAEHRVHADEKPAAVKAALPAKNILSRLFGWFSAFRR